MVESGDNLTALTVCHAEKPEARRLNNMKIEE
jgi:hypothetical protein